MAMSLLAGRYELRARIGVGGYGEVWRGVDTVLARPVAIKLLQAEHTVQPEAMARFRAEARHAGALSHPCIAHVYDYCEPDPPDPPFLVMELVDGLSLAELLTRGPLDVPRAMDVIGQAAAGLHAAHQARLVHRDIKPGNLLISRGGPVKITDFGIAQPQVPASSGPVTMTGMVLGTAGYMAPERVEGNQATVASDLYALGVVAHECLAGLLPRGGAGGAANGATGDEPVMAPRSQPLPPLPASIPPDVAALVSRLTARDPARRPASAGEVARQAAALRDRYRDAAGPGGGARSARDAAPDDTAWDHVARDGATRNGAAWAGAAGNGAARNGAVRDGTVRDGTVRDGAAWDGSARDATALDGIVAPAERGRAGAVPPTGPDPRPGGPGWRGRLSRLQPQCAGHRGRRGDRARPAGLRRDRGHPPAPGHGQRGRLGQPRPGRPDDRPAGALPGRAAVRHGIQPAAARRVQGPGRLPGQQPAAGAGAPGPAQRPGTGGQHRPRGRGAGARHLRQPEPPDRAAAAPAARQQRHHQADAVAQSEHVPGQEPVDQPVHESVDQPVHESVHVPVDDSEHLAAGEPGHLTPAAPAAGRASAPGAPGRPQPAGMQFCLLGPLLVRRGAAVLPIPAAKHRVLLAALLLQAGRPAGPDELTEVLWGPAPPVTARVSLQNYVMRLRRILAGDGPPRIVTQPGGYLITVGPGELDISRFEAALAAGRAAARAGAWGEAAAVLAGGLALWRGEPLSAVPSEVLLAREVPRLAELRLQALEARIDAELHLGRAAEVIVELRGLVAAQPLRERLHARLMTALARDGQRPARWPPTRPSAACWPMSSAPSPARSCSGCSSRSWAACRWPGRPRPHG